VRVAWVFFAGSWFLVGDGADGMSKLIGMVQDGQTLSDAETPPPHQLQTSDEDGVSVIVIISLVHVSCRG
jgi:hypothetical protein